MSTLARWFIFGFISVIMLILCGYRIYRLKTDKKRYGILAVGLFLVFWLNILCYSKSLFFLCKTLIVVGLFAFANIPSAVGRDITKGIVSHKANGDDTTSYCKRRLRRMEWVRFFPIKHFIVACIWISCLVFATILREN